MIVKLILSCEMRVTSECNILIYDVKHCYASYDVDWYVYSHSYVKNHQSKDLKSTTNNSVLYLYLFLEELIVKLHVRIVGSSCTHLYMIHQLLTGLRLITRPGLLIGTQDTIHALKTPNRVNILNQILIYSESSSGFHRH